MGPYNTQLEIRGIIWYDGLNDIQNHKFFCFSINELVGI